MDSLYSRYASALYSLSLEENQVDYYRKEIKAIKKLFLENKGIIDLFSSCFISLKEKEDVIDKIFSNENKYIISFIKVIVKNDRAKYFDQIFQEFIYLANDYLNIKDGIVYSKNLLNEDNMNKIKHALELRYNCEIDLINIVDERLLGGIKVQIEDKIFDGSVKNKLEKMKENLLLGGIENGN